MSANLAALVFGITVFAAAVAACYYTRLGLVRWSVLDAPSARSSHTTPVPRGGGLGFIVIIVVAWILLAICGSVAVNPAVILGVVAIAAISFADDLSAVSLRLRLLVQAIAVAAALWFLPAENQILADVLPFGVDRLLAGLAWLWFVNLFNFMDGIDGIAGAEAAVVSFGLVALATLSPDLVQPAPEAIAIGAAALAFLMFNWPPARVFMGDVGSASLGYLLGWLLILTAARGALAPAIILPLYFVADATTTLIARAWRRQPLGQAHRDHAYQRAVDKGRSHVLVSSLVVLVGVGLIALAGLALTAPLPALAGAAVLVAGFTVWLRHQE